MFVRSLLLGLTALTLSITACRKSEITSYRVPKEKDPQLPPAMGAPQPGSAPGGSMPMASGGAMANPAVPTAEGPGLTWTAPSNWKLKPAAAMRKATYAVPGEPGEAELSITAFPSDVGGEVANFNRWRGQVQLPSVSADALAASVTRMSANDLSFAVGDFSNPQAPAAGTQHIVGAIVPFAGATWFFKLSGSEAVVANVKPQFLEFLKTVKASAPVAP